MSVSFVNPSLKQRLNRISSDQPDGRQHTISYLLHELSVILNERVNVNYRCKMDDHILALLLLN